MRIDDKIAKSGIGAAFIGETTDLQAAQELLAFVQQQIKK